MPKVKLMRRENDMTQVFRAFIMAALREEVVKDFFRELH